MQNVTYSSAKIYDLCKALDKEVEEFRTRPINGSYQFGVIDAAYFRGREKNRIVSKALMVASGTIEHCTRKILGFQAFPNENTETWTAFPS